MVLVFILVLNSMFQMMTLIQVDEKDEEFTLAVPYDTVEFSIFLYYLMNHLQRLCKKSKLNNNLITIYVEN